MQNIHNSRHTDFKSQDRGKARHQNFETEVRQRHWENETEVKQLEFDNEAWQDISKV